MEIPQVPFLDKFDVPVVVHVKIVDTTVMAQRRFPLVQ